MGQLGQHGSKSNNFHFFSSPICCKILPEPEKKINFLKNHESRKNCPLKAAAEKDFAFLEKSNAKRQQAIQMKSEIEKTTESVSKIEKKIKEL